VFVVETVSRSFSRVFFKKKILFHKKDDVGRTPLHNACWTNNFPSFNTVELLLEKDVFLMQLTDSRGYTPLAYVREEHWPQWKEFLDRVFDQFWPAVTCEDSNPKRQLCETPVLARLDPNSFPMKDPTNALNLELARLVANGTIAPEDAMLLQEEDLQDSLNDEGDDDDDSSSCNTMGFISMKDSLLGDSTHHSLVDDNNNIKKEMLG
jgi:hypothetical protein